jgi:hypothetical protein
LDRTTLDGPTPPPRWDRLKSLFQAALDQPPTARAAFVRAQAPDPVLADEVLELLAADARGSLVIDDESSDAARVVPEIPLGGLSQVGPYRIEAELARGGMGRVFRATREQPRRSVAIKLMHRALDEPRAIRRFEYESQILADLAHPNIAHVYESGTVEYLGERIPWYAMELVEDGRPLDTIEAELGDHLDRKLELFLQACDGVHHAHQKGVIHRDLKPANVLVDRKGRLKLIDFGIAKSLMPELGPEEGLTAQGQVMGTLAYMAPEQTSSRDGALDVRVDVYALGLILYRLLAGRMPYLLDGARLREAVRTICEAPPDPAPLAAAGVPTDLRLIANKALAKRADDRYASVAALAADVRRFRAREPIEARPPSLVYQLGRFARRNPGVVASGALVAASLAVGAAVSTWGYFEARVARDEARAALDVAQTERDRAERARTSAEQARDFAVDILAQADPWQSRQPEITLRRVLELASERLGRDQTVDVATEVQARRTLHEVFAHLGDHAAAEREVRRALTLAQDQPDLADARLDLLVDLASALLAADRIDEADAAAQDAVAEHQARLASDDPRAWRAQAVAAAVLEHRGRLADARAAFAGLADAAQAGLGDRDELTLQLLADRARVEHALGELSAAEQTTLLVWEGRRATLGADHPLTLTAYQRHVQVLMDRGRLVEADEALRELVAELERVLGPDHASTGAALGLRAMALRRLGRSDEAVPLARRVLEIAVDAEGPTHVHALRAKNNLALALDDTGARAEALTLYEELDATWAAREADADASYLVAAVNHAQLLGKLGRAREGLVIIDRTLERARRDYPPDLWLLEYALVHRARLAGEPLEALAPLLRSEKARSLAGLPPRSDRG